MADGERPPDCEVPSIAGYDAHRRRGERACSACAQLRHRHYSDRARAKQGLPPARRRASNADDKRRPRHITTRLDDDELAGLDELAEALGLARGRVIRELLLGELARRRNGEHRPPPAPVLVTTNGSEPHADHDDEPLPAWASWPEVAECSCHTHSPGPPHRCGQRPAEDWVCFMHGGPATRCPVCVRIAHNSLAHAG